MSWSYRIVDHGEYLALHEVFYHEDGEVYGCTETPVDFGCDVDEGPEGIVSSLRMALRDAECRGVLSAQDIPASEPPAGTPAEPCPFCGGKALACETFPKSDQPWFVHVRHLPGCEMRSGDGARQCHATEAGALASWNRRAAPVTATVAATNVDSRPVPPEGA